MRRITKKILLFVIIGLSLTFIFSPNIYASTEQPSFDNIESFENNDTPSKNERYNRYDYVIDKYDINIVVNENNTLDITETITAYFKVQKHGIYRTIPLKNTITRLDGTSSTNRAQVTNVSVNREYTTSRKNENYEIKIGSASYMVTGEQNYVIKYTYKLGKDPIKNYDELYYNIIGNEWDTVIGNVTFTITMPKEFDPSKLGFSSGTTGSTDNSKVKYNIIGNKISGSYEGILNVGEALTVRCELPDGYFVGSRLSINPIEYIMFGVPITCLLISILLWYKFGRDDEAVETVEFYPPEGFNSLEVGFLYHGKAVDKDVVSLLIYLANKGYIQISETGEKELFSEFKEFKITKLKEYDSNNVNEQLFLSGIFSPKALIDNKHQGPIYEATEVTSSRLRDSFYIAMGKILSNINNKSNKHRIFNRFLWLKNMFLVLMILITFYVMTIPLMMLETNIPSDNMMSIVSLITSTFSLTVIAATVISRRTEKNTIVLCAVFSLMFGSVYLSWVIPILLKNPIYLVANIIGILCIIGMYICLRHMPKRTEYGNEILGKLKGFKKFLEIAEKEQLESMVMENPNYFYDILPYTYVLGVSDKWIKKFETIAVPSPSWYDNYDTFDVTSFGTFINNTMASAGRIMSSNPSTGDSSSGSSSSGSSSGGGSSGGGSGGGGGGSW